LKKGGTRVPPFFVPAPFAIFVPKDFNSQALEDRVPVSNMFSGGRKLIGWLIAICAFVYGNTLSNDYVGDDLALITHNTYVQAGAEGLKDIWTKPTLRGFDLRPVFDTAASNDLYRPLAISTFALEHQLVGENPGLSHLVNLLLFALCVVLLFRFLHELMDSKHIMTAFIASVPFAVHPIHTEVVANIKSRDELLCFAFAFGALLQFLRYYRSGTTLPLLVGSLLLFVSLLAKETSISFVAIIPLVAVMMRAQTKQTVVAAVTAAIVAGSYIALRYSVLNAWNANHPEILDFMENPLVGAGSLSARYGTALAVMGRYIGLLLCPYPLSSDYTFATIPFTTLTSAPAIIAVALYGALVVGAFILWRKPENRIFAFCIIFFLCTLALFTNLAFLTGSVMAERFLFFPSVGFCLAVALLWQRFLAGRSAALRIGVPVVLCVIYAPLTMARNADWRTNYTLAKADAATHPRNARLHHSLAYVLINERLALSIDAAERNELANEARQHYLQSLEIYPKQSKVHTDYANLLAQMGRYDSAEAHILQALDIRPGDPVIISMLGGLYFTQGKYDKTLAMCRQAHAHAPNDVGVLINISVCQLMMKQFDSVIFYAEEVLKRDPKNATAQRNMRAARDSIATRASVLQNAVKNPVR